MDRRFWMSVPLAALALVGAAAAPRLLHAAGPPPAAPPAEVAAPTGDVTFGASVDRDRTDAAGREVRVRVDLDAGDSVSDGVPTDLVVVLDRSGSMAGGKIEDARAAALALYDALGPDDRLALVSFAGDARVDVPLSHPDAGRWATAVSGLAPGGSTDLAEGLDLAATLAVVAPGRAARVVVLSDGRPDQRAPELVPRVARIAAADVPVTAVGIGADWDETLMRTLADAGAGNLRWVQQGPELAATLADELHTAGAVVAQSAVLRLDGPATVLGAGGYPTEGGRVRVGSLAAGGHRGLWLTVRVDGQGPGAVDLGSLVLQTRGLDGQLVERRVDLPTVTVEADATAAYASLGDDWARGVVQEQWNAVRQDVSAHVQQGDQAGALELLGQYQSQLSLVNAYARNEAVVDNLNEAQALERKVQQVFADDARVRNEWSKGNMVGSTAARR